MKKLLSIISFVLLLSMAGQSQNNNDALNQDLDRMMQQMEQMMKGLGNWIGEAPMMMDTTIIREFHFPTDELNGMMYRFSPDSLMNGELFQGMEDMMQGWSDQDWSGMERFFQELGDQLSTFPDSDIKPEDPAEDKAAPKNKKKKRKTTTL